MKRRHLTASEDHIQQIKRIKNDTPFFTKHMVLLPKWLLENEGLITNANLFFYYAPIVECLKQLMSMGVFCLVLDWHNRSQPYYKLFSPVPKTTPLRRLSQYMNFHIEHLEDDDAINSFNWDHVTAWGEIHFGSYRAQNNFQLYVHDGAGYLDKRTFAMTPHRLLDSLIFPQDACQTFESNGEQVCRVSETAMQALLHYLESIKDMVAKDVRQQHLIKYHERQQARQHRARMYKRTSQVDTGCLFCKPKKQKVAVDGYVPLYEKELLEERKRASIP